MGSPGGSQRRGFGRTTDEDRRTGTLARSREDMDVETAKLKGFAAPCRVEGVEDLVEQRHAAPLLHAEHGVFVQAVPDAERHLDRALS